MATINFDNKEAISEYPSIPEKNKVTDANINLIKQVGNQILTTLGVYTDTWDDTTTYLIDDVVVYDNRYFKNLTGTNTSTPPDEDTTNWLEVSLRDISGGAEIPIQDTAPANPREDDLWIDTSESAGGSNILDTIFPVGSIIIKADNNDYSNWLGFTWERTLVGRVAVGIDTTQTEFDTIGETGGSKEMQSHYHDMRFASNTGDGVAISTMGTGLRALNIQSWEWSNNGQNEKGSGSNLFTNVEGTGNSGNLQPYQVVAYWKRTA